ncbi:MAG: M50 family metallopeptidase [Anaerolineales bacterium]|nr:M50 family metallopeptidase [Anaerolineales bacterium]MCB9128485.1 M50 family metallopeptidase [Ardenticatenales bacterium]MCB9172675.1 M50 family metallopeptidase [Ardenticatenales bacterium]
MDLPTRRTTMSVPPRSIDWRIVLASIVTIGVALLFWGSPFLLPLKLFVVLLHEMSHALAAWLTGGAVERLIVTADEGGLAFTRGGNRFLISSAGYLGSLIWGVVLMQLSLARPARRRVALRMLALLLALAVILSVRDPFTLAMVGATVAAALLLARYGPPRWQQIVLWLIGSFSALYAIIDIGTDILSRGPLAGVPFFGTVTFQNDAEILAAETFVPAFVWGLLWITLALAVYLWNLRQLATRR